MTRLRRALPYAALFALVLGVYVSSPVIQSGDGRLVVFEAHSVVHDQNLDLTEFGAMVHGFPCYREGARTLSRYPYGTALVVAPLFAAVEAAGNLVGADPTDDWLEHPPRALEKLLASILAAFAVLALVLLGRIVTGRRAPAFALGLAFAFGTALWSTVSRGLWQHGPLILLVTLGLLCLVRGRDTADWRWSAMAGVPFGMAYVVRPTALVVLGLTAVLLLLTRRRAGVGFVVAAAAVIVPSIAYNLWIYDSIGVPFYWEGEGFLGSGIRSTFFEGLAGTIISPSRGLLSFSPFLALAAVGVAMSRRRLGHVEWIAIGSCLVIWLATANTKDWPGGWSYGPRLLADTLPFLFLLMLPVADRLTRPVATWTTGTATLLAVVCITGTWSVLVQARGAYSWSTQVWNPRPTPAGVEHEPSRYWSWGDAQFTRGGHHTIKDIYPHDSPPDVPSGMPCVE